MQSGNDTELHSTGLLRRLHQYPLNGKEFGVDEQVVKDLSVSNAGSESIRITTAHACPGQAPHLLFELSNCTMEEGLRRVLVGFELQRATLIQIAVK